MKYKLLCLFVLLSFSLSDLYADIELSSKQMRTSDGLPSNSVRCMFQDSKGFLWLGTLDGLTRYDGNTFLTYQLESGKHDQISYPLPHVLFCYLLKKSDRVSRFPTDK